MSDAAEKIYVSQPALTKSLQSLEQELNTQLFDRCGKRLVINDRGKIVLRHTDLILQLVDSMTEDLSQANLQQIMNIGTTHSNFH